MKKKIVFTRKTIARILAVCSFCTAIQEMTIAQVPDCVTGTVMYGVFNQPSNIADSTEFRSINFSTGAIGPLMGGRRFWIRRVNGSTTYYGSSAMGLDPITNAFYVLTQMPGNAGWTKYIIRLNTALPVAATDTGIQIAVLPTRLNNYHFVKAAIGPDGNGYAIGVNRDTTSALDDTCNVLIRFTTCGLSPSKGCGTAGVTILGYLPKTAISREWQLYNGDILFDSYGNLFFASSAFQGFASSVSKYTDARLFRINHADIPTAAGSGFIPMSLVADFNGLDSMGVSGVAVDGIGNFYFAVRRYTNSNMVANSSGSQPFIAELYKATIFGTTSLMLSPATITANFSIGDLGSGYYPFGVLSDIRLRLSGRNQDGDAKLKWEVNRNADAASYELQRGTDGNEFQTVSSIATINSSASDAVYNYNDRSTTNSKNRFYRIKQVLKNGNSLYSNVIKISDQSRIELLAKPNPNPFTSKIEIKLQQPSAATTIINLIDQNGRNVYHHSFTTQSGENHLTISDGISQLTAGIYIIEIHSGDDIIREKIIKQ